MRHYCFLTGALGVLLSHHAIAADCSQKRGAGSPSGKDLGKLARSKLTDVCYTITNTTGLAFAGVPVEGYQFWGSNPQTLSTASEFCTTAFNQIIKQCVEDGDFYGGQYFFDGQVFNLTNAEGSKSPISGNAVKNPGSPPTMPQQNGIPFYQGIKCGDGVVGNPRAFGRTRWGEAGSQYALEDFNNHWKNGGNDGVHSYIFSLSNFWNGPEGWDCGIQENQCSGGLQSCGDLDTWGPNGHTVKNPAAWQILNAITNIHNFYVNQYNAFDLAKSSLMSAMPEFSQTFSPVPQDDSYIIKIIIDVLTIGYGQIAAGLWNVALKKVLVNYKAFNTGTSHDPKLDGDRHGWSKDGVNTMVTGMLSLGKDLLPKAKTQLEATQKLDSLLGLVVDQFSSATSKFVEKVFSGTDEGVSMLSDMIKDGKWIDGAFLTSDIQKNNEELKAITSKILYAQLIPAAWSQVGGLHPIIIYDDKACAEENKNSHTADAHISKDMQDKTGMCYKNKGMWILSVNDGTQPSPLSVHQPPKKRSYGYPPTIGAAPHVEEISAPLEKRRMIDRDDMEPDIFDLLPGATRDVLKDGNWGGVEIEDIIISSYEAYIANNNQNGYTLDADDENKMKKADGTSDGDTLFSNGIRTPGVFNFPICSIETAVKNWRANYMLQKKPEFYPCNKDGK